MEWRVVLSGVVWCGEWYTHEYIHAHIHTCIRARVYIQTDAYATTQKNAYACTYTKA